MLTESDVISVLNLLQAEGVVRLNKINGDWYSIYCPIHSGGSERRPSAGVLLHEQVRNGQTYSPGFVHCFTCGLAKALSELYKDLRKEHNISPNTDERIFEILKNEEFESDSGGLLPDSMIKIFNANQAVNYIQSMTKPKIAYVSEKELASYRYTVPYMYERGLTDEIIERYDIGVDMNYVPPGRKRKVPCVTFPVRDSNGNCLFVARRSIANKNFFLPENVDKPVYGLYELPKGTTSVVIVESVFNLTTCVKYGRPAVALLGTGNSLQASQLRHLGVREFILGFDPDDAGKRATRKWKKILQDIAIVWSFEGIPEGKDINDLDYETFSNLNLI